MKCVRFLRGLPGSGKTYLATIMAAKEKAFVSSDDDNGCDSYFDNNDESHFKTQKAYADLVRLGLSPIVIDNCNIKPYYLMPYVRLAHYYGYEWSIIDTDTPWRLDVPELLKRNKRKIPAMALDGLKSDYLDLPSESLTAMLRLEPSIDPEVALREAALHIEKKFYGKADEFLFDYEDWYINGGYRPPGGNESAASLSDKLKPWQEVNYCPNMVP